MRLASVDVGSNSIHMVVVETRPGMPVRVLAREKDMARLGDSVFRDGHLSASAQARAIAAIDRFLAVARRFGVESVVAAATSAVRDAENGKNFLALVRRETGLRVALLDPREEARLIYLGVREATDLRGPSTVVVDIGGGSTEVILGDHRAMRAFDSLPLGVLRLNARFDGTRTFSRRRRRDLREHVREVLEPSLRRARGARVRRVVGTAGTVNAIARVLLAEAGGTLEGDAPPVGRLLAEDLRDLGERLLAAPLAKRRRMPGVDPERADTLAFGCVILDEVLRGVGVDRVRACRAAVREGMILDHLATHPETPTRRGSADVRERSVRDAADRYAGADDGHPEHVSRLALALFDGTRRLHRLGDGARELLAHACRLHDVGQHVEYRRHHRHSYYLVRNADLQGFEPEEVEVLAFAARFHRKTPPKPDQAEWDAVPRRLRRTTEVVTALLRVADGLDRGHAQEVTGVTVRVARNEVVVRLRGRGDLALDAWAAAAKADLFGEAFGRPIRFDLPRRAARARRKTAGARTP